MYAVGFWIGVATVWAWVSNLHFRIFVYRAAVLNSRRGSKFGPYLRASLPCSIVVLCTQWLMVTTLYGCACCPCYGCAYYGYAHYGYAHYGYAHCGGYAYYVYADAYSLSQRSVNHSRSSWLHMRSSLGQTNRPTADCNTARKCYTCAGAPETLRPSRPVCTPAPQPSAPAARLVHRAHRTQHVTGRTGRTDLVRRGRHRNSAGCKCSHRTACKRVASQRIRGARGRHG